MIEGSGSGSIPLTNGSGSGRPKNICIRIRIRIRHTGFKRTWGVAEKGEGVQRVYESEWIVSEDVVDVDVVGIVVVRTPAAALQRVQLVQRERVLHVVVISTQEIVRSLGMLYDILSVLRIRIRRSGIGAFLPLDLGFGMEKKSGLALDPGSWMEKFGSGRKFFFKMIQFDFS